MHLSSDGESAINSTNRYRKMWLAYFNHVSCQVSQRNVLAIYQNPYQSQLVIHVSYILKI